MRFSSWKPGYLLHTAGHLGQGGPEINADPDLLSVASLEVFLDEKNSKNWWPWVKKFEIKKKSQNFPTSPSFLFVFLSSSWPVFPFHCPQRKQERRIDTHRWLCCSGTTPTWATKNNSVFSSLNIDKLSCCSQKSLLALRHWQCVSMTDGLANR